MIMLLKRVFQLELYSIAKRCYHADRFPVIGTAVERQSSDFQVSKTHLPWLSSGFDIKCNH